MALTIRIRPLAKSDDRSTFASSNVDINEWFTKYAGQAHFRKKVCTVWVAEDEPGRIVGFVATARAELPGPGPEDPSRPVLLVARLAVATSAEGRGIATRLLRHCFTLALEQEEVEGYVGLLTEAKPGADPLYARSGFVEIGARDMRGANVVRLKVMFIPLDTVRQAMPRD